MTLIGKMKKNKKGFTLIELIVVIAILAILALIAIPRLAGFSDNAKASADQELVKLAEHTVKTLIASGDLTIAATKTPTLKIAQTAATTTPATYSGTDFGFKTGGSIQSATFDADFKKYLGSDNDFQRYTEMTITFDDDGEVTGIAGKDKDNVTVVTLK